MNTFDLLLILAVVWAVLITIFCIGVAVWMHKKDVAAVTSVREPSNDQR